LVPPPNQKARLRILKIFTKNMPLADDVNLEQIAKSIEGFSGADIESLCREAAMLSLREDMNSEIVALKHFELARKKVHASITPETMKYYEKAKENFKRASIEVSQLPTTI
ncbi:MAG: AAA family ATPase, partial [Candidatus Heimdallarchaeota archaeon]